MVVWQLAFDKYALGVGMVQSGGDCVSRVCEFRWAWMSCLFVGKPLWSYTSAAHVEVCMKVVVDLIADIVFSLCIVHARWVSGR